MPPRDALLATGLFLAAMLVIAGLVVAYSHHILRQVIGAVLLIGFLLFLLWVH